MANRNSGPSRQRKLNPLQFERLQPRQVLTTLLPSGEVFFGPVAEYGLVKETADFKFIGPVDVREADNGADIDFVPTILNSQSSGVVGRYVFYNDSVFDGEDPLANAEDDNAIATDKVALLPGQTATFDNYTNFDQGINGISIDIFLADAEAFTSDDINLSVGSGDNLSDFERLGVRPEVSVRPGAGVNGSDRISIILPNGSVTNEYLQVTVYGNGTTGLSANDVFYFGNVIGDTGNSASNTLVSASDIGAVRGNLSGFFAENVDSPYDINRDRFVNSADIATIRDNLSGFFSVPLISAPVPGNDFFVASAAEIDDIINQVQPGDTITLQNGFWTNQEIDFNGFGTEDRPITLRAQTPGQVILNGSSSINISGDWLVVDGLNFDGGALEAGQHVVEFRGDLGEANNSRFTNSAITNYNPDDINTRYFWVSLYGQNNRVDHNSFSGQNHSGVTVTVWRNTDDPDFHLIDNNYFADRPEGNSNGWETIRLGTSDRSLSDSFTTVENNLFERTDGEIEIISNKSGSNIFRNNTFRESAGTLTLRHGDNNLVEGNYFLGEGKDRSGGVRVIGENQTVVNNYFEGLDGRADGAISISAGAPNSPLNGHFQVRNAIIAHNTIVNVNEAAIIFDQGFGSRNRTLLAENVTIANNLISSTLDPLFEGAEGSDLLFEGNVAFGQSLGSKAGDSGITVVNPQLELDANGIWRLSADSPAIDSGIGGYAGTAGNFDIDGQLRDGAFDVGADEFSTDAVVRGPLEAADVGHFWLGISAGGSGGGGNGGGGNDCPSCVAVHASDFSSVLDPNNDGDTFTVQNSNDALGGSTLVAPDGDRVNLPGTHDAIVSYDLEFSEAGTYTAYYRARGFSGSSDSFYTPDDFGATPDNFQSLSNDGNYTWESGGTFEVSSSDLGSSVEFSIGKREAGAELNAIVLHLDSGLSDAELDALFS